MFIGRSRELALLEERFRSSKAELVVLYGRRRIGKSSLIQHFVAGKTNLLFEGLEGQKTPTQIEAAIRSLREQWDDPLLSALRTETWRDFLLFLTERIIIPSERRVVICFDELQWLAAGRTELVSILKYFWDNHWKKANVMVILCGSIASFMIGRVIKSKALYGRISLELPVRGLLPFEVLPLFGGKRGREEVLQYLLTFGGVPKYLEEVHLSRSFAQNMNRLCFSPEGIMVREFERIFYSQFREHRTYLAIISLMNDKLCSLDDIARKLKMPSGGGLRRYLSTLEDADFISQVAPFGGPKNVLKFRITDEYLVFYFKYIAPNRSRIERGASSRLFETICDPSFASWLGYAFERFCLKHATYLAQLMGFAEEVVDAGPFFKRRDTGFQIDLLFKRADSVITLCEIKHQSNLIDTEIIPEVERKCQLFPLPKGYTLERALISVHGPTPALRRAKYFHHIVELKEIIPG